MTCLLSLPRLATKTFIFHSSLKQQVRKKVFENINFRLLKVFTKILPYRKVFDAYFFKVSHLLKSSLTVKLICLRISLAP